MTKAGDSVVSDRNNRMKNSNNRGYSNRGNGGGNHQNGYRNSQYNNGATNNGDKETNNAVSANAVLNKNLPKPSQDQLNVSKMLDIMSNIPEDKIQMLMSITACSRERASDLLHECNLDVQAAV